MSSFDELIIEAGVAPGTGMRDHYDLDPALIFLNHGSYGAVAKPLKAAQDRWRLEIDRNPDGFIRDRWPELQRASRTALAAFLDTEAHQIGLVANATSGLQAAAVAAPLKPGQKILIPNQTYPALTNILRHVSALRGTEIVTIDLPSTPESGTYLLDRLETYLADDVGLMVVDHITSPTATRFPVTDVIRICKAQGVPVLVDGAHAPGHVPLNLSELDADWYVGNGHKWLGAPRGTAFIWSHEKWLERTETPVISHNFGKGFEAAYVQYGTIDYSAWASIPDALTWYRKLDQAGAFAHAKTLVATNYAEIADRLEADLITDPDDPGMMAAMLLPRDYTADMAIPLRLALQRDHGIVAVFIPWQGQRLIARLSCYSYSSQNDLDTYLSAVPVALHSLRS